MTWKRNYLGIWLSQFFSMLGFSFALPFAPFYLQELGVNDPVRLSWWVAVFGAAAPMAMALFSPLWGIAADRFGRRAMLLRANFAGSVIIALMGLVHDSYSLVLLRLLQGMFTGTMTAAQAMVSGFVPAHRSGFALGALSAAVFSGSTIGAFAGGICAHYFGYRVAFLVGGSFLLVAGSLVLFATREQTLPPDAANETPDAANFHPLKSCRPILALFVLTHFLRVFDGTYLPLLVQDILGSLKDAALWTGVLSAATGAAGFLAGVLAGHLSDRIDSFRVARTAAIGAGILTCAQGVVRSLGALAGLRFGATLGAGGLEPVLQTWLARATPVHLQGMAFGWAGTARALGWMTAPLLGGLVASTFGLRAVFIVSGLLYIAVMPLMLRLAVRQGGGRQTADNG